MNKARGYRHSKATSGILEENFYKMGPDDQSCRLRRWTVSMYPELTGPRLLSDETGRLPIDREVPAFCVTGPPYSYGEKSVSLDWNVKFAQRVKVRQSGHTSAACPGRAGAHILSFTCSPSSTALHTRSSLSSSLGGVHPICGPLGTFSCSEQLASQEWPHLRLIFPSTVHLSGIT